jgi:hypothetical protein
MDLVKTLCKEWLSYQFIGISNHWSYPRVIERALCATQALVALTQAAPRCWRLGAELSSSRADTLKMGDSITLGHDPPRPYKPPDDWGRREVGRPPASTSSMCQTKSASALGGRHHVLRTQGWMSFFSRLGLPSPTGSLQSWSRLGRAGEAEPTGKSIGAVRCAAPIDSPD